MSRFKSGCRSGQAGKVAASRPNHRRGFHAAVIISILPVLSACGNISCEFLGPGRLRSECQDNTIMVPIYTVKTYIPGKSLKYLVDRDRQAQVRGL